MLGRQKSSRSGDEGSSSGEERVTALRFDEVGHCMRCNGL